MSERVETIGDATLYLGDCLDILPSLGKVDAVVTDPPYGVGLDYGGADDSAENYAIKRPEWKAAIDSVSDGPRLISCGVANIGAWEKPDWIIAWLKPAAMGRCFVGFNNWEPVLCYGKPAGRNVDAFTAGILPDRAVDGHPCPKPIGWASQQISRYTTGMVLDPFMGSGTTGVACANLGREFIGIEIEPKYFDIARKRIEDAYKQPRLFEDEPVKPEQVSFIEDMVDAD